MFLRNLSVYKRKLLVRQSDQDAASVLCSYSGGSEELSDDITQQQLLPGVKYVKPGPPIRPARHTNLNVNACVCHLQRSQPVDGQM